MSLDQCSCHSSEVLYSSKKRLQCISSLEAYSSSVGKKKYSSNMAGGSILLYYL